MEIKKKFRKSVILYMVIALSLIGILEYFFLQRLNYHISAEEISDGTFLSTLLIIISVILFIIFIRKRHSSLALALTILTISLITIQNITWNQGIERYATYLSENWTFTHDKNTYFVERNKFLSSYSVSLSKKYENVPFDTTYIPESDYLSISKGPFKIQNYMKVNAILEGQCIKTAQGWDLINDSLKVKISGNYILGFPKRTDSIVLRKGN